MARSGGPPALRRELSVKPFGIRGRARAPLAFALPSWMQSPLPRPSGPTSRGLLAEAVVLLDLPRRAPEHLQDVGVLFLFVAPTGSLEGLPPAWPPLCPIEVPVGPAILRAGKSYMHVSGLLAPPGRGGKFHPLWSTSLLRWWPLLHHGVTRTTRSAKRMSTSLQHNFLLSA